MTVGIAEMHGYPQLAWDPRRGYTATRKLMVPWASALSDVMAIVRQSGTLTPFPYGEWGLQNLRVARFSIEPFPAEQQGSESLASYEKALATIEYEECDGEGWSESMDPQLRSLPLPYEKFCWGDGEEITPEEAPFITFYTQSYTLTKHLATSIPDDAFTKANTVNRDSLTSRFMPLLDTTKKIFEPETLLFCGIRQRGTFGTATDSRFETMEIEFNFSYNPKTWNRVWRAKTGLYEEIYSQSDINTPYKLFKPEGWSF